MIGVVSCKNKFYLIFECFRFYFWRKKEIGQMSHVAVHIQMDVLTPARTQ